MTTCPDCGGEVTHTEPRPRCDCGWRRRDNCLHHFQGEETIKELPNDRGHCWRCGEFVKKHHGFYFREEDE
jgi:hypothetical protein